TRRATTTASAWRRWPASGCRRSSTALASPRRSRRPRWRRTPTPAAPGSRATRGAWAAPTTGARTAAAPASTTRSCATRNPALARDWYEDTQSATPSPALTKALLVNTATDLAGGPNDEQGWGRLNVGGALDSTVRGYYDQLPGDVLTSPGQTVVRSFTVPDTS